MTQVDFQSVRRHRRTRPRRRARAIVVGPIELASVLTTAEALAAIQLSLDNITTLIQPTTEAKYVSPV